MLLRARRAAALLFPDPIEPWSEEPPPVTWSNAVSKREAWDFFFFSSCIVWRMSVNLITAVVTGSPKSSGAPPSSGSVANPSASSSSDSGSKTNPGLMSPTFEARGLRLTSFDICCSTSRDTPAFRLARTTPGSRKGNSSPDDVAVEGLCLGEGIAKLTRALGEAAVCVFRSAGVRFAGDLAETNS